MNWSHLPPVVSHYISQGLLGDLRARKPLAMDTAELLYNRHVVDAMRQLLTEDDLHWISAFLRETKDFEEPCYRFIVNLAQHFLPLENGKQLYATLKEHYNVHGTVALVFALLGKPGLSLTEIEPLFHFIQTNWDAFQREESHYENPDQLPFVAFQEQFEARMQRSPVSKQWIYLLASTCFEPFPAVTEWQQQTFALLEIPVTYQNFYIKIQEYLKLRQYEID